MSSLLREPSIRLCRRGLGRGVRQAQSAALRTGMGVEIRLARPTADRHESHGLAAAQINELLVFAMPLIFAFSIGVSFISPQAAELSWLLVFLVRPVLLRITHYSGNYDES
jgi:hypothetical protein